MKDMHKTLLAKRICLAMACGMLFTVGGQYSTAEASIFIVGHNDRDSLAEGDNNQYIDGNAHSHSVRHAYGGIASGANYTITGGTWSNKKFFGGYQGAILENNYVGVTGGTFTGDCSIYGAYINNLSSPNNFTTQNNTVKITGGEFKIDGGIAGANSYDGDSLNNKVIMSGITQFSGDQWRPTIIGGFAYKGIVSGNQVILYNNTISDASIAGGRTNAAEGKAYGNRVELLNCTYDIDKYYAIYNYILAGGIGTRSLDASVVSSVHDNTVVLGGGNSLVADVYLSCISYANARDPQIIDEAGVNNGTLEIRGTDNKVLRSRELDKWPNSGDGIFYGGSLYANNANVNFYISSSSFNEETDQIEYTDKAAEAEIATFRDKDKILLTVEKEADLRNSTVNLDTCGMALTIEDVDKVLLTAGTLKDTGAKYLINSKAIDTIVDATGNGVYVRDAKLATTKTESSYKVSLQWDGNAKLLAGKYIDADGNTVTTADSKLVMAGSGISSDMISADTIVAGTYSAVGDATNGVVNITAGDYSGTIYGGYSTKGGEVSGNVAIVSGKSGDLINVGTISAGYSSDSSKVTNNALCLAYGTFDVVDLVNSTNKLYKNDTVNITTLKNANEDKIYTNVDTEVTADTHRETENIALGGSVAENTTIVGKKVDVYQGTINGTVEAKTGNIAMVGGAVSEKGTLTAKEVELSGQLEINGAIASNKVVSSGADISGDVKLKGINGVTEIAGNFKGDGNLIVDTEQVTVTSDTSVEQPINLSNTNKGVAVADKVQLTINNINIADDTNTNITGSVKVNETVTLAGTNSVLNIGTEGENGKAGHVSVEKMNLKGGTVFLDPSFVNGVEGASTLATGDTAIDGSFVAGRNSLISFGTTDSTKAINIIKNSDSDMEWSETDTTAGAYIDSTLDVTNGSLTVDGSKTTAPTTPANGTVTMADNSLLIVNADKAKAGDVITGVSNLDVADTAKLMINGAEVGETYQKITDNAPSSYWIEDNIIADTGMIRFSMDNTTHMLTAEVSNLGSVIDTVVRESPRGSAARDFFRKYAANSRAGTRSRDEMARALNAAGNMSQLAGVEKGTMEVNLMTVDAANAHLGVTDNKKSIWANYLHSKNNVSGLPIGGMNADYSANYNGVILGYDFAVKDNYTAGVAVSHVEGGISGEFGKNEAEYTGLSLYGKKQIGSFDLFGDITYVNSRNKISHYNSGARLTALAKADTFSTGVSIAKRFNFGKTTVTPYTGARYMHIGTGDFTNSIGMNYDSKDVNLLLLPVGVRLSTEVARGQWSLKPSVDIGYSWNLGNIRNRMTVGLGDINDSYCYNVLDRGVYVMNLGFEATRNNISFGIDYSYHKSSHTNDNKINVNFGVSF